MIRRLLFLVLIGLPLSIAIARAGETKGGADIGLWYEQNNLSSASNFVANDGVGQSYVQDRYMLLNLGLKLDSENMFDGTQKVNGHVKGRALINLKNNGYTLGIPDRTRQEVDEMSLEFPEIAQQTDLWFGRQTIYEAGGAQVDGLRGIYHLSEKADLSLFGGLGTDGRNETGYIGPSYRATPFTSKFQTGGFQVSHRTNQVKTDGAIVGEFFKGKLDRTYLFAQTAYQIDPVWGVSGLLNFGVAGDKGIRNVQAVVTTRPTTRITNTISFTRYASFRYKESNDSAIPVPTGVNSAWVGGTDVSTSSYNSGREHIMIRVFDRNYIFGAFQFTHRTFDDLNQYKYTAGYRDPNLFGSTFDLRMQTDLINNYRGFNTAFDLLLGKDLADGEFRLEGGGTFYANERDSYLNNVVDTTSPRQTEKENAIRFNAYYYGSQRVTWLLNYAFYNEVDATNLDQKIRSHEVYISSNIRF